MRLPASVHSLRIEPVGDDDTMLDWLHVHNAIVPAAAMTVDEVRERVTRYRLEVGYLDGSPATCTTVRPPESRGEAATVIVRVLPEYREQGLGGMLYARALEQAHDLHPAGIETIVWEANTGGLRFAASHGFVEVSRYLPDGEDVAYVTLRLATG